MYLQTVENLKLSIEPDVLQLLSKIHYLLNKEGIEAYLVGGFVRDVLLGRSTADIDIAVAADAFEIATKAATALGGKFVPLDEVNRVARVVLWEDKRELDFSTIRGNLEQDLAERDFSIDAIAIPMEKVAYQFEDVLSITTSMLIDPFKGGDDLREGIVRAVNEKVFQADPARLLRAVRLAAELGFVIHEKTEALIRRDCHLITGVAGERVREELLRILALPRASRFLAYLDKLGLLTAIIPELAQEKGVSQPVVHFWDVFEHSIQTVAAVEFLLRQSASEYAGEELLVYVSWSETLSRHFEQEVSHGSRRGSILKLAALLHDVAKPQTRTVDESGRTRFLGHPVDGAVVAASILERLRFTTKEIKLVELLVKYHLRPGQMSGYELPTRRAIYRYFRDTGEAGIDVLFLSLADHLATRGPYLELSQWQEHTKLVDYVLEQHFKEVSALAPPKLTDGHDLINIFSMNPGPKIGIFLEAVREAQASGEVTTKEEALAYIRDCLQTKAE